MDDPNLKIVRKSTVTIEGKEIDLRHTTVEQRWDVMSQLTIEAYAKMGVDVRNQPMRKDVERLTTLKQQ